jgi:2-polyprenyl-3-methyl-5-hydroxy-6-metoxy-1,4-benzoquinol methylase
MEIDTRTYRDRIYGQYASVFKDHASTERLLPIFEERGRFFDYLMKPVLEVSHPRDVLEVGCGVGAFLYWSQQRGLTSVRGFDVSHEQVEIARRLGLAAEAADYAEYFPSHPEAFDLVVGLDVVEHLTRDEVLEFLDLCWLALRPGGYVFLTTPNGAGVRPGPVIYGDLTHETFFTPQTITLALKLAGFDDIRVDEMPPPPLSVRARIRRVLWRLVRLWFKMIDVIEMGGPSTPVYTRVMCVLARRPPTT